MKKLKGNQTKRPDLSVPSPTLIAAIESDPNPTQPNHSSSKRVTSHSLIHPATPTARIQTTSPHLPSIHFLRENTKNSPKISLTKTQSLRLRVPSSRWREEGGRRKEIKYLSCMYKLLPPPKASQQSQPENLDKLPFSPTLPPTQTSESSHTLSRP